MRARALRVPGVVGSLILTASCLLLEPLDDVEHERARGGAGGEAGADAVSAGAAGASQEAGGAGSDAGGASGASGGEAGSGGTTEPVESSGGTPSEAGAPSAGGSVSAGGTTGGTLATGGTTGGAITAGGTTGGMTGGMTGVADECVPNHTCDGATIDDFEGCSYPPGEDQPVDHQETLGCKRPGEAMPPEIHFICKPAQGSEPCSIDWAVMPHPARPDSRVLCFWGTERREGEEDWQPFLVLYLHSNEEDYYDVTDTSSIRFSYCSNEPLHTYLGCKPSNEQCFDHGDAAGATLDDDDDDPATCQVWKTVEVPLNSTEFSAEERRMVRSLQLQIKTKPPGPFKLCIDDVEFVD